MVYLLRYQESDVHPYYGPAILNVDDSSPIGVSKNESTLGSFYEGSYHVGCSIGAPDFWKLSYGSYSETGRGCWELPRLSDGKSLCEASAAAQTARQTKLKPGRIVSLLWGPASPCSTDPKYLGSQQEPLLKPP